MLKYLPFGFLVAVTVCAAPVKAHSPVEFLEVLQGEPSNLTEHAVELKGFFDQQKVATELEGPYHFSLAVGCMGRDASKQKAYLAWYKIVDSKKEAPRKVAVLDLIRGAKSTPVTIESAEYFLSPAQRITTGPPSEIPEGLDHYKAYRILDAPSRELSVKLVESAGPAKRIVGKPLFLCVAAEEWHHDDYFQASHRRACYMVYELDAQDHTNQISLIDQFGLNQFSASKSQWLCVGAMLSTESLD
jgi:hypothetical protein